MQRIPKPVLLLLAALAIGGFALAASDGDWSRDRPGLRRHLKLSDLPAPRATPSAARFVSVVAAPAGALPQVPAGFKVERWFSGLDNPRVLRIAPSGDVFISETSAGRIRVLRPGTGGAAPTAHTFATGLDGPFGLAFHPSGSNPQWLYVANENSVVRFAYRNGDLRARAAAETIVKELAPGSGGHSTRDLLFTADGRRLLVSVGSESNVASAMGRKNAAELTEHEAAAGVGASWGREERRAQVLAFSPDGASAGPAFATGLRNCVGMALQKATGAVWCAVNERDGLGEDLVPDYATRVRAGAFYGWPWYYLGANPDPSHAGARPDLAAKITVPDVLLQSHSAALGITFYEANSGSALFPAEYRGDAFVALHGSWNRAERTGYKVVRLLMRNGLPTGEYADFMTGFVLDAHRVWGRPVGVAVMRDGALLVSEDGNDIVWKISWSGA